MKSTYATTTNFDAANYFTKSDDASKFSLLRYITDTSFDADLIETFEPPEVALRDKVLSIVSTINEVKVSNSFNMALFLSDESLPTGADQSAYNNLMGVNEGIIKMCKNLHVMTGDFMAGHDQVYKHLKSFDPQRYICFCSHDHSDYLAEVYRDGSMELGIEMIEVPILHECAVIVMPNNNVEYYFEMEPDRPLEYIPASFFRDEETGEVTECPPQYIKRQYFNFDVTLKDEGKDSTVFYLKELEC